MEPRPLGRGMDLGVTRNTGRERASMEPRPLGRGMGAPRRPRILARLPAGLRAHPAARPPPAAHVASGQLSLSRICSKRHASQARERLPTGARAPGRSQPDDPTSVSSPYSVFKDRPYTILYRRLVGIVAVPSVRMR